MDIIQAQRETRELTVNAQYIVKMMDGEAYEGFDPAWTKLRTINARKAQICSLCHTNVEYMAPVNVYLSTGDDGQFHRHNMCMECMTKLRRQTAAHIANKHADQLQSVSQLNSTHLKHMTLEQGQQYAARMQEEAIYLQSHIPANEIARDGLYLYDVVRAVKATIKHYCYRCSGRIMPEETTFAVPPKTKRMTRQEHNYICQTCAVKSLHASSKRIDQYKKERQL